MKFKLLNAPFSVDDDDDDDEQGEGSQAEEITTAAKDLS